MDSTAPPDHPGGAPLWSVLLVPALGLATAACGTALTAGTRRPWDSDAGALIGLAAAAAGCAVVAAWLVGAALAVLSVLAGRRRWDRLAGVCRSCSPALLRRAAAAALGLQLLAAPAATADDLPSPFWDAPHRDAAAASQEAPASGASAPAPPAGHGAPQDAARAAAPGAGDRPAPAPPPAPCAARPGASAAQRTVDGAVTVVRGDTLWSLAAARLGPEADDARIARAWPRWYELNRHVLLDGPHRLLPGQRLLVPGSGDP